MLTRVLAPLQRLLARKATIADALEALLWLGLPYTVVGVVVAFFHVEYVRMLTPQFDIWLPAGAEVAAFGQIMLMWPGLLLTSDLCMH